ncbi:MAG: HK97 family phage prohead protease [Gammaproteobacteria bacterium]|nr:HK97 family phage prohead protease [Gammaproteobacteria bacterium]
MKGIKLTSFLDKMPKQFRDKVKVSLADYKTAVVNRVATDVDIKEVQSELKQATMYLSTRRLDRDNDIVIPDGMDLELYKMNPVVLFGHDYGSMPIAKTLDAKSDGYGVLIRMQFADTERANEAWSLVKDGYLRTLSAGFQSKPNAVFYRGDDGFTNLLDYFSATWSEFKAEDRDNVERIIARSTLIEASLVPVPANPYALIQDVKSGKLKLSDDMAKRVHYEKLCDNVEEKKTETEPEPKPDKLKEDKTVDEEKEVKDIKQDAPAVPVPEKKQDIIIPVTVIPACTVKQVVVIKPVMTQKGLENIIAEKVKLAVDYHRGIVR